CGRAAPGAIGELVVTNLGRTGSPVIRYRTGDLVRPDPRPCLCGRSLLRLDGGILGRSDDMIHLRGNNFLPGSLENVLRRLVDVAEYRAEVIQNGSLATLRIEGGPAPAAEAAAVTSRCERALRRTVLFA